MIDKLYNKYFQKSKSFLYPALGIKRSAPFSPIGTYLSIKGMIPVEDMMLICSFKEEDTEEFKNFESLMLTTNPLYLKKIKCQDQTLYIFDLQVYQADWANFVLGKYSKLSVTLKRAIKSYYGENSIEYKYIETYMYPYKFFDQYASLLDISVDSLKKIGELCDPFDMDKETLEISLENLEILEQDL